MLSDTTLIITDIILGFIIFFVFLKWIVKEIRDIARDLGENLIADKNMLYSYY